MKGQAIEWVEQQPGSKRGPLTSESMCGRNGAHIYLDDTSMEMGPTQKEILRVQSVSFSKKKTWKTEELTLEELTPTFST